MASMIRPHWDSPDLLPFAPFPARQIVPPECALIFVPLHLYPGHLISLERLPIQGTYLGFSLDSGFFSRAHWVMHTHFWQGADKMLLGPG